MYSCILIFILVFMVGVFMIGGGSGRTTVACVGLKSPIEDFFGISDVAYFTNFSLLLFSLFFSFLLLIVFENVSKTKLSGSGRLLFFFVLFHALSFPVMLTLLWLLFDLQLTNYFQVLLYGGSWSQGDFLIFVFYHCFLLACVILYALRYRNNT